MCRGYYNLFTSYYHHDTIYWGVSELKLSINALLTFPVERTITEIAEFIRRYVEAAGADGVVVGVSGGIDSSVALALAVKALGKEHVTALILPDRRTTPNQDVNDALTLVKLFDVRYHLIYIDDIVDAFSKIPFFDPDNNIATGNLRARVRMNILYYFANRFNNLVLGTGDRSEILIGYFTKYGDGAVDLLPLACLYKTQVRHIAQWLGVPERIIKKPSSPRLWPGHLAEKELGMKYEDIDLILYGLFDLGLTEEQLSELAGIRLELIDRVITLHRRSRHKRGFPPYPRLTWIREPLKEL